MKKHTLRPISVLLLAFLVVMPQAWVGESHAQASPQERAAAAGGMK